MFICNLFTHRFFFLVKLSKKRFLNLERAVFSFVLLEFLKVQTCNFFRMFHYRIVHIENLMTELCIEIAKKISVFTSILPACYCSMRVYVSVRLFELKSILPKYFESKFLFLSVWVCAVVLIVQIMCNQCHITATFSICRAHQLHLISSPSTYWFLLVSLLIQKIHGKRLHQSMHNMHSFM